MKTRKYINSKITYFLGVFLIATISCERGLTDEAEFATLPNTAEIFTDNPVSLTDAFFISFDPADGANVNGFGTDNTEAYLGTTSIRIDVPDADDSDGSFIGGIFKDRGNGRDLTEYNALTFWAKASTTADLGTVGFGTDFVDDKHAVSMNNAALSTDWKQYIIPIPDASKLVQEFGMFLFAAGTQDTGGLGYIIWIDEIKFENLGTIAQPRPAIMGGEDVTQQVFSGGTVQIVGTQTFNLDSGENVTTSAAPSYFDFESSDTSVAIVNESGQVSIIGEGAATITATLAGVLAEGSITVESVAGFENAPDPTLAQADVLSIFSDSYTGVADFNPGAFAGSNTGNIQIQALGNNNHINYESIDFVGLSWDGTSDVSGYTNVHFDFQLVDSGGSSLVIELLDFGPDDIDNGFADGTAGGFNVTNQLTAGQWVGIDIPLNAFTLATGGGGSGSPNLNNLGNIIFVSSDGASFLVDNVYFY